MQAKLKKIPSNLKMTAAIPVRNSPVPDVKKSPSADSSYVINEKFLEQQTIKVFVRLKPLSEEEKEKAKKSKKSEKRPWKIEKSGGVHSVSQRGSRKAEGKTLFHFDEVFEEDAPTPYIYKSMARSMVHTVLNGKHATIFAYGQTGSGKTYTMQGEGKAMSGQAGIIQLVVSDLFRFMRTGAQASREFVVKVSYLEVYNERLRDLLSDDAADNKSDGTPTGATPVIHNGGPEVLLRTNAKGEVTMNCTIREVKTVEEALELLIFGNTNRVVAKTDMNKHSSRSHAIYRLTVESFEKELGPGAEMVRLADFNLVDLAGSEGAKSAGTSGKRQNEGAKINQSLLSLSNVINALSQPEKKRPSHINYRDSKLTRILQPHLQGNAEMAIICCANGEKTAIEETRSTLKFGARAKLISVKPKVNELNDDSALIKRLQNQLAEARRQIEMYEKELAPDEDRESLKGMSFGDKSVASDDMNVVDDEEQSYGYDDMDAGPGHREYNFVSNQEHPPPPGLEKEDRLPMGAGGRAYVMPKNTDIPPELERDYAMTDEDDDDADGTNQDLGGEKEIPLDLGREYGDMDSPTRNQRTYQLPDGEGSDSHMDQLLKGRVGEDDSSEEDGGSKLQNSAAFRLDSVDPLDAEKNISRFMKGRTVTDSNSDAFLIPGHKGSRYDQTGPTEMESVDSGDGPVASYEGVSMKFGSVKSRPDTLRGGSTAAGRSVGVSLSSIVNDRIFAREGNKVSWDTMNFNTMQADQIGKPMKAVQSIYKKDERIPEEITIMQLHAVRESEQFCLTDRLNEAEERAAFMEGRLEKADDLVEGIFKDLERARLCIHDLVYRNTLLRKRLETKKREDIKEAYQEGEVILEHYWLLKGSMYVGLFFFFSGGFEYFMATVFFVWLILEINLNNLA